MERLTYNFSNIITGLSGTSRFFNKLSRGKLDAAISKLRDYEDAEEQGLLIWLPCKVGDTVWVIIKSFTYGEIGDRPEAWYRVDKREFDYDMIPKYGKTVFLTREGAEAALKEA